MTVNILDLMNQRKYYKNKYWEIKRVIRKMQTCKRWLGYKNMQGNRGIENKGMMTTAYTKSERIMKCLEIKLYTSY